MMFYKMKSVGCMYYYANTDANLWCMEEFWLLSCVTKLSGRLPGGPQTGIDRALAHIFSLGRAHRAGHNNIHFSSTSESNLQRG